MLKKTYVANCISNGEPIGYVTCCVWFWVSPYKVTDILHTVAKKLGGANCYIIDIRRLK